jgi:hypothetical protein
MIVSSHKIGGPKGAGALVSRGEVLMPRALIHGGGQEKGHRSGTENSLAVIGFGAAAHAAVEEFEERNSRISQMRDRLEAGMRCSARCDHLRRTTRHVFRTPRSSRCRASRPRPGRSPSISRVWRCRQVLPARPAKSAKAMCWSPWATIRSSGRCASRSAFRRRKTISPRRLPHLRK